MLRVVLAFLLAPALGTWLVSYFATSGRGHTEFGTAIIVLSTLTFGYPSALLAGIPAFIEMRRNGWLSLASCISVALFCAAISWFFVWLALSGATGAVTVFMALSAVAGGTIFWLVGVSGNSALTSRPSEPPSAAAELNR